MSESIVRNKSKAFAVRIINLYKHLYHEKHEYVLSKQILRCGTSIGANICEALCSMSKREFISKLNISLKEAAKTEYWLELLKETSFISEKEFESLNDDCNEVKSLLISIIKTSNKSLDNSKL